MEVSLTFGGVCEFIYVNHRGERSRRRVIAIRVYRGTSPHYQTSQWLLKAYDLDKHDWRDFALDKIEVS